MLLLVYWIGVSVIVVCVMLRLIGIVFCVLICVIGNWIIGLLCCRYLLVMVVRCVVCSVRWFCV